MPLAPKSPSARFAVPLGSPADCREFSTQLLVAADLGNGPLQLEAVRASRALSSYPGACGQLALVEHIVRRRDAWSSSGGLLKLLALKPSLLASLLQLLGGKPSRKLLSCSSGLAKLGLDAVTDLTSEESVEHQEETSFTPQKGNWATQWAEEWRREEQEVLAGSSAVSSAAHAQPARAVRRGECRRAEENDGATSLPKRAKLEDGLYQNALRCEASVMHSQQWEQPLHFANWNDLEELAKTVTRPQTSPASSDGIVSEENVAHDRCADLPCDTASEPEDEDNGSPQRSSPSPSLAYDEEAVGELLKKLRAILEQQHREELQAAAGQLDTARKAEQALQLQLDDARQGQATAQQELGSAQRSERSLKLQLSEVQEVLQQHQMEAQRLKSQLAEALKPQPLVQSLKAQLADAQVEIKSLKLHLGEAQQRRGALMAQLEEEQKQQGPLRQSLAENEKVQQALKCQLDAANENLQFKTHEVERHKATITRLKKQNCMQSSFLDQPEIASPEHTTCKELLHELGEVQQMHPTRTVQKPSGEVGVSREGEQEGVTETMTGSETEQESQRHPKPLALQEVEEQLVKIRPTVIPKKINRPQHDMTRALGGILISGEVAIKKEHLGDLAKENVSHIISCCPVAHVPLVGLHKQLDCDDSHYMPVLRLLRPVVNFLKYRSQGNQALIHCREGINRSATLAVAIRMMQLLKSGQPRFRSPGELLREAWTKVAEYRGSEVVKNPHFQRQLFLYADLLIRAKSVDSCFWPEHWGPEVWLPAASGLSQEQALVCTALRRAIEKACRDAKLTEEVYVCASARIVDVWLRQHTS